MHSYCFDVKVSNDVNMAFLRLQFGQQRESGHAAATDAWSREKRQTPAFNPAAQSNDADAECCPARAGGSQPEKAPYARRDAVKYRHTLQDKTIAGNELFFLSPFSICRSQKRAPETFPPRRRRRDSIGSGEHRL